MTNPFSVQNVAVCRLFVALASIVVIAVDVCCSGGKVVDNDQTLERQGFSTFKITAMHHVRHMEINGSRRPSAVSSLPVVHVLCSTNYVHVSARKEDMTITHTIPYYIFTLLP